MKVSIVLLLGLVMTACCPEPPKHIQMTPEVLDAINHKVQEVETSIAKCDVLAKCMGYKSGSMEASRGMLIYTNVGAYAQYFPESVEYVCTFAGDYKDSSYVVNGKTHSFKEPTYREVASGDIAPMLAGCEQKKCGKECKR